MFKSLFNFSSGAASLFAFFAFAPLAHGADVGDVWERPEGGSVEVRGDYPKRAGANLSWQDLFNITHLGGVAVSPKGDVVAFVTQKADADCNCYDQKIHLYDIKSGKTKAIADPGQPFAAVSAGGNVNGSAMGPSLRWSKDGRYLAFVKNEGDEPRLHLYDHRSGAVHHLATGGDLVYGFTWTDKADTLIYQTGHAQPDIEAYLEHSVTNGFRYSDHFFDVNGRQLPTKPEIPVDVYEGSAHASSRAAVSVLKRVRVDG